MNLKKYLLFGGIALGMGLTSCVGDLDLDINDPNQGDPNSPDFTANTLGICYSGIAVSGISGPVSSYVAGLDPGTSAYLRLIFTLSEFCSDELTWIWPNDEGGSVGDLVACTWSANNSLCYGAYRHLQPVPGKHGRRRQRRSSGNACRSPRSACLFLLQYA